MAVRRMRSMHTRGTCFVCVTGPARCSTVKMRFVRLGSVDDPDPAHTSHCGTCTVVFHAPEDEHDHSQLKHVGISPARGTIEGGGSGISMLHQFTGKYFCAFYMTGHPLLQYISIIHSILFIPSVSCSILTVVLRLAIL